MLGEAGEAERAAARARADKPFAVLSAHLAEHDFLEDRFSVADAYLLAVFNWCEFSKVPIGDWPVLHSYRERLRARPSVQRAIAEEWPLLQAA